jgi:hypothetical protein
MKKIFVVFLFFLFTHSVLAVTKVTIQDSPPQVYVNQEFDVVFNVVNDFVSSDSYYIKGRIGSASASLNKGETYNPITNNWFSDTSLWSNFPTINFNNDTIATASVKLRTNQTISIGNNLLVIRVSKNSNYDSSSSALLVFEPTPTITLSPTLTPTITPTIAQTITPSEIPTNYQLQPTPLSYDNIFLSEAMVNPVAGEKEWVEIYNNNDFSVSLNNWYIDDLENAGSSPKVFSLEIGAKSYGVFDLPSSIFNNDGDTVRLLDFNKNLKDDFEYLKSEQGKTLGRITFDSDNFCLQEPSKNAPNNSCINPTQTVTPTLTLTTGRINPSPTKNILQTKMSIITGRETRPLQYLYPTSYPLSSNVLGLSNKLIIEPSTNKPLINLLCFLSSSYSLLTIISILFRMKLSYGKDKNLYSSSLYSS